MMNLRYNVGRRHIVATIYKNVNVKAQGGDRKSSMKKGEKGQFYDKNRSAQIRKANRTVNELVNNNFDNTNSSFATLTFNDKAYSKIIENADKENLDKAYEECKKAFKKFLRKIRNHFGKVHYVAVPELQKDRGVIHFHMIWNIRDLTQNQLYEIWGHGSVRLEKVYNEEKLAKYISKEIKCSEENFIFNPHYLRSKGLRRSDVAYSWMDKNACKEISKLIKYEGKLVYKQSYFSDDEREIEYLTYKMKKCCYHVLPAATKIKAIFNK